MATWIVRFSACMLSCLLLSCTGETFTFTPDEPFTDGDEDAENGDLPERCYRSQVLLTRIDKAVYSTEHTTQSWSWLSGSEIDMPDTPASAGIHLDEMIEYIDQRLLLVMHDPLPHVNGRIVLTWQKSDGVPFETRRLGVLVGADKSRPDFKVLGASLWYPDYKDGQLLAIWGEITLARDTDCRPIPASFTVKSDSEPISLTLSDARRFLYVITLNMDNSLENAFAFPIEAAADEPLFTSLTPNGTPSLEVCHGSKLARYDIEKQMFLSERDLNAGLPEAVRFTFTHAPVTTAETALFGRLENVGPETAVELDGIRVSVPSGVRDVMIEGNTVVVLPEGRKLAGADRIDTDDWIDAKDRIVFMQGKVSAAEAAQLENKVKEGTPAFYVLNSKSDSVDVYGLLDLDAIPQNAWIKRVRGTESLLYGYTPGTRVSLGLPAAITSGESYWITHLNLSDGLNADEVFFDRVLYSELDYFYLAAEIRGDQDIDFSDGENRVNSPQITCPAPTPSPDPAGCD